MERAVEATRRARLSRAQMSALRKARTRPLKLGEFSGVTISSLGRHGWIVLGPDDRTYELTDEGRKVANAVAARRKRR